MSRGSCCARRTEYPHSDPMVLGDPNGLTLHVRLLVKLMGLQKGREIWVTGSSVQALMNEGWIEETTSDLDRKHDGVAMTMSRQDGWVVRPVGTAGRSESKASVLIP